MNDDQQRLNLPEPEPGIGTGFLEDVWRGGASLPRINTLQRALFFLQRAVQNLMALLPSSMITVMTIAVSIFLFSGFLLILKNVDHVISGVGSSLNITLYFKTGASEEAITNFVRELEADRSLRSVKFVSKEAALDLFRHELGQNAGFLRGLENDNPLPASVDITLQPDELGINNVTKVVERLKLSDAVDDASYGSEWVDKMLRVIRVFRAFGMISLGIVLFIIIFLISNTIKLVIFSRREEIGVMQLVGATDLFIQIPFALGGIIQGLIGSLIGLLMVQLCYVLVNMQLKNSVLLSVSLPSLQFLSPAALLSILVLGLVVGGVGSIFALGRFMDV